MNDWKIRQELYHRINREHDDDLNNFTIELTDNIVENAVKYFTDRNLGWVYPSKSYMVAICYSRWLSRFFGDIPENYLNDPSLLYNNDFYFVEYTKDPDTYHSILNAINGWNFDESAGMIPDVYSYFIKEFLLDIDPL